MTYLWYVLLNKGIERRAERSEIPDEAIAVMTPFLQRDGLRRNAMPELALDLVVTRNGRMLFATIKRDYVDLAAFAVAGRSLGAAEYWRELHLTQLDTFATDPERPPRAPWVGVALSSRLRQEPRVVTLAIIGLCKATAWTWIEMRRGQNP